MDKPQDERRNANTFSFLLWIPPKSMCSFLRTVCYRSALVVYSSHNICQCHPQSKPIQGGFNAARCLQVQVLGGGAPIDRVCLLQGRAEVHHKASPPSGRFRYVSSVWIRWSSFLVKCQEKNMGRYCLLCLQEGSVWFVRDFFFHP